MSKPAALPARRRLRLLPGVLFVGSLILTVRIGALWDEVSLSAGSRGVAQTVATDPAAGAGTLPVESPEKASEEASGEAPVDAVGEVSAPGDPLDYTDEEVDLLQALAQRRAALDAREQELGQREGLLAAAEQRMDQKIAELKTLQQTIEGLVAQHDQEEEKKYKSLVKIYESMKPKDAAQIFEQLDMEVLLEVVGRMREQKAAPVLAQMDAAKAKEVTLELAQRRKLPIPK